MSLGVWRCKLGSLVISAAVSTAAMAYSAAKGARADAPLGPLESINADMVKLWGELPLNTLPDPIKEQTKQKYDAAAALFKAAAEAPVGSAARYRATAKGTAELREVGLWLPLALATDDARDVLVKRFIDLEDRALGVSNAVYATLSPGADAPFQLGREQWRLMAGSVTLREAEIRCGSLVYDGTKNWRLPDLNELWRTSAVMKDARTNTAFGAQAEKMSKVWTSSKAGDKQQYYIDFKTAKIEIGAESAKLETVCVGEMEDGS